MADNVTIFKNAKDEIGELDQTAITLDDTIDVRIAILKVGK